MDRNLDQFFHDPERGRKKYYQLLKHLKGNHFSRDPPLTKDVEPGYARRILPANVLGKQSLGKNPFALDTATQTKLQQWSMQSQSCLV